MDIDNTPIGRRRAHRFSRGRSLLALVGLVTLVAVPLAPSVANAATASVVISESSNAKVVTVARGSHFTVTLHSTYWSIKPVTGHIVTQIGKTLVKGSLMYGTQRCVPGQGCGTVTANYVANAAGTVRLNASRTTCGEVLLCSKSQSHWTVVIRVR